MAESRRERKVITVVFADLVGFTAQADELDPEDVEKILRPYHELLRRELTRFGGTVEKFLGDAVVAVFGAPIAHEDDPERAVRAALSIRDRIREGGTLQVRIGVNTGNALVRVDVDPSSGEGFASGDVLNSGARLQTAAPVNGILVGAKTYEATKGVVDYAGHAAVDAKGKARPLVVWEALQARSRLGVDVSQESRLPLVGRTRERALLLDTVALVESERSPQLVTLVGVPGIGKSRLLFELLTELESREGLRYWRQGRCLPYGEGVSFWALSEMVKAQAGILEQDDDETVGRKLSEAVSELIDVADRTWIEDRLRPLVGLEQSVELGGDEVQNSFTAWRAFFEALADQRPLVLVFEDLHWADDGLLEFVDALAEWSTGVPMLIVCTARPELLERRPGWGGGKLNTLTLRLAPLSEDEASTLLSSALGEMSLPADDRRALIERAGGNPLYAEQYARLYTERATLEDLPLPQSIEGLIAARLDALSVEEKALLRDAAVIGKVFWLGALGQNGATVDRLHTLERKEFIRRERRSSVAGEDEFAFRHVLVRDVAYGQIPRAERADKHVSAARWIESLGRPQDHAELLAFHYGTAFELASAAGTSTEELAARAKRALRAAGDRAYSLHSYAGASALYDAALRLTPDDDPDRPQLLFQAGQAQFWSEMSGDLLREAAVALDSAGDKETAAEAETLLAWLAWERTESSESLAHLDRANELVESGGLSKAKAHVLASSTRFLCLASKYEQGLELGRHAIAAAEALGLDAVRAEALLYVGQARHSLGDPAGLDDVRASAAIFDSLQTHAAGRAYHNLSQLLRADGRLEESDEAARDARRVMERFGTPRDIRWLDGQRAARAYASGEWEAARRAADAFLREQEGDPHRLDAQTYAVRALMRLARDQTADAADDASRAIERGTAAGDAVMLIIALDARVAVLGELGEEAKRDAGIAELIQACRSEPDFAYLLGSLTLRAIALSQRADEFAAEAARGRPTPWLAAAKAALRGDWSEAADTYEEIRSKPNEAFARLFAAEALIERGQHAAAVAELSSALDFYRSVGATRYIRRTEALQAVEA